MILYILLGIWLSVPVLGWPFLVLKGLWQHRTFNFMYVFSPGEFFGFPFLLALWPIAAGIGLYEYYQERKERLEDVQQTIEIHYRDKWYE